MYVLVKVDYDYHRFQENVVAFRYIADAIREFPELEMYTPDSEREDFFNNAELSHYWLQSFYSKEVTAKSWWSSLLYSDKARILELYDDILLPPTTADLELDEVVKLWDFHNKNYNKD